MDGKYISELCVAITAVNPSPHLIKNTDKFAGKLLDDNLLDEVREMVRTQSKPMRTTTVKPWYRRRVIGAIARRLTAELADA
jgi:CO/xanthine dehydrogenase FAD-binding subunit